MSTAKGSKKKSGVTPQQLLELGKIPPQAIELEEAVLGAMMLDRDALANVIDLVKPDMFYKEAHQHIFQAIHDLFHDSSPVDILTVTQQLKKNGELQNAGGAHYVTTLTNRITSSSNIEVHARLVIEQFLKREVIRVAQNILQEGFEDTSDVFSLLESAEQQLFDVSQNNIKKNYKSIKDLLGEAIKQIEGARDQQFQGVPSGYSRMDAITGGWQNADFILLAARPAMGKTAFAISVARNAAVDFGKPIAIFSLEMTAVQLTSRLISMEAEFSSEKLRKGDLTSEDFINMNHKISKLAEAPIFIDDTPALSVFDFRAKARRLKSQHGVGLIVIDYLQLMTMGAGKKGNREQEVSMISQNLKAIAKELNIPIIALSQLSRAVETRDRGSKKPQLSDLRESGSLEQDADLVMFLYRPEYYGITVDDDGNSTEGIAEVIIAKHRNGRVGTEQLMFIPHFTKFIQPSESLFYEKKNEEAPFSSTSATTEPHRSIEEDF